MEDIIVAISKEVLSVALLLPLLWYFINSNKKQQDRLIWLYEKFQKSLQDHMLEDSRDFEKILSFLENNKKTNLDDMQSLTLLKMTLWFISDKKLEFIKSILINNHINNNQEKIRKKIYNWLDVFNNELYLILNSYINKKWSLGDFLKNNFTIDEFNILIDEIVDVIYREENINDDKSIINNKISDIGLLMKTVHNKLSNKFLDFIK